MRSARGALFVAIGLLAAACTSEMRAPRDVRVDLKPVAVVAQPLALAVRDGDSALYIAQKFGRVVALDGDGADPRVVLDISGEVSLGTEQGLLGIAFSPDGEFLYINYTDTSGHTHVTEFPFDENGADEGSRRDVLFVEQPFSNHNGGNLAFGPDGYLYIGLGDGGSAGDPLGNGQSLSTLLGKMLRISPRPSGNAPYGVPRDNPFVGRHDARPEIWAYGLRNPWRYSFDRQTGDLWIGDVGQGSREEVDRESAGSPGGRNYGWSLLEGTRFPFHGAERPDDAIPPIFEYPTSEGCAITGGYVYRGSDIPELVGAYVFGDFCNGRLQALTIRNGRVVDHRDLGPVVQGLASFGEDADGELYALGLSGQIYRLVRA